MKRTICCFSFFTAVILALFTLLPCSASEVELPEVRSVLLYDITDEKSLYEQNAGIVLSPSSVSKLITGALAYQKMADRLNETVLLTDVLLKDAPKTKLMVGNQLSLEDLIRLTLCQRNNDAAFVLANYCSGSASEFVNEMNRFAALNGCAISEFANPAGLEYGTYHGQTSANDLAILITNLLKTDSFLTLFQENVYSVGNVKTTLLNKGMTDDVGYCRVTISNVKDHQLLCIVLGADSETDAQQCTDLLTSLIFNSYSDTAVLAVGQSFGTIPVKNGAHAALVPVQADGELLVFTDNPEYVLSSVRYEVHLYEEQVEAPVNSGVCVGTVTVWLENEVIGTMPIVASNDVTANSFSLAIYNFGILLRERKMIAAVSMMAFLFIVYFVVIHRKNKKRQIMLQRFKNEHKDIYKR